MGRVQQLLNLTPITPETSEFYAPDFNAAKDLIDKKDKRLDLFSEQKGNLEKSLQIAKLDLPEENEAAKRILNNYQNKIDNLSSRIQNDKLNAGMYLGEIHDLAQEMNRDIQTGGWYHIMSRYNDMENWKKQNAKMLESSPELYNELYGYYLDKHKAESERAAQEGRNDWRVQMDNVIQKPTILDQQGIHLMNTVKSSMKTGKNGAYIYGTKEITEREAILIAANAVMAKSNFAGYARQQAMLGKEGFVDAEGNVIPPIVQDEKGNIKINEVSAFAPDVQAFVETITFRDSEMKADPMSLPRESNKGKKGRGDDKEDQPQESYTWFQSPIKGPAYTLESYQELADTLSAVYDKETGTYDLSNKNVLHQFISKNNIDRLAIQKMEESGFKIKKSKSHVAYDTPSSSALQNALPFLGIKFTKDPSYNAVMQWIHEIQNILQPYSDETGNFIIKGNSENYAVLGEIEKDFMELRNGDKDDYIKKKYKLSEEFFNKIDSLLSKIKDVRDYKLNIIGLNDGQRIIYKLAYLQYNYPNNLEDAKNIDVSSWERNLTLAIETAKNNKGIDPSYPEGFAYMKYDEKGSVDISKKGSVWDMLSSYNKISLYDLQVIKNALDNKDDKHIFIYNEEGKVVEKFDPIERFYSINWIEELKKADIIGANLISPGTIEKILAKHGITREHVGRFVPLFVELGLVNGTGSINDKIAGGGRHYFDLLTNFVVSEIKPFFKNGDGTGALQLESNKRSLLNFVYFKNNNSYLDLQRHFHHFTNIEGANVDFVGYQPNSDKILTSEQVQQILKKLGDREKKDQFKKDVSFSPMGIDGSIVMSVYVDIGPTTEDEIESDKPVESYSKAYKLLCKNPITEGVILGTILKNEKSPELIKEFIDAKKVNINYQLQNRKFYIKNKNESTVISIGTTLVGLSKEGTPLFMSIVDTPNGLYCFESDQQGNFKQKDGNIIKQTNLDFIYENSLQMDSVDEFMISIRNVAQGLATDPESSKGGGR